MLCVLAAELLAVAYIVTTEKQYDATTRLVLEDESVDPNLTGFTSDRVAAARVATDVELIASPAVATRAIQRLRLDMSPESLAERVSAVSSGDSRVMSVTVRDTQPKRAAQLANVVAEEYIAFSAEREDRRYDRVLTRLRAQLAQAGGTAEDSAKAGLRAQIRQLELLRAVQGNGAEMLARAQVPASASVPQVRRILILVVALGLLAGLALVFLRDRLDRRIRDIAMIERLLPDIPLLASLPSYRTAANAPMLAESMHILCSYILVRDPERDHPERILITSAMPGDGKSTVALNLALAAREQHQFTTLVDGDLRLRTLTTSLNVDDEPGLSSVLTGRRQVDDCLLRVSAQTSNGLRPFFDSDVDLLPAGPAHPSPQSLLRESNLGRVMAPLNGGDEITIFDGPPLGLFSDMLALAKMVEGVIIVVRLNHTRNDRLRQLVDRLQTSNARIVGMIVVDVPEKLDYEGYYA